MDPFYGTGVNSPDAYTFRSQMCPWITCCYDMRAKTSTTMRPAREHEQWKQVAKYFLKDFYPLMPYAAENTAWVAWQFEIPSGGGVVQVFRRAESFYESASLKLRPSIRSARYELTDFDSTPREVTGEELANGLSISLKKSPQSRANHVPAEIVIADRRSGLSVLIRHPEPAFSITAGMGRYRRQGFPLR